MLKVETAGQADKSGNHMKLVGVVDAHLFRSTVLQQRELVKKGMTSGYRGSDEQIELLRKIAASLEKIEDNLKK